jgi:hypothetical protein
MKNLNDEQFGKFIKDVIGPVNDTGPSADLWPRMLGKLADSGSRFSWFDWVLAALAVALCIIVPDAIPGLLYHF